METASSDQIYMGKRDKEIVEGIIMLRYQKLLRNWVNIFMFWAT